MEGREPGSLSALFEVDTEKYRVIAVVGGGGKTSLIYRLTEEFKTGRSISQQI